jgi:predicted porin
MSSSGVKLCNEKCLEFWGNASLTFSTHSQNSVQLFGIMAGSRWGLKGQEDKESLVYAGVPR